MPYRRWLADLSFPLAPQHIALQEYRDTIDETERRVERLTDQLRQLVPTWRWAPVVDALQALRGGITKAGNPHARRLLAEAAWAYPSALARIAPGLLARSGPP